MTRDALLAKIAKATGERRSMGKILDVVLVEVIAIITPHIEREYGGVALLRELNCLLEKAKSNGAQ